MFKQSIALWKKEKKGTTLHKRLLLFFISVSVSLILIFTLLLSLFGITGKQQSPVKNHLTTELSIISNKIDEDFGKISVTGISIAEDISLNCDNFFAENNIKASELKHNPQLIEPLLAEQMQTLISTINNHYCGGVFIMLDTSITPDSETSKAGVFLKKTQPTATTNIGLDIHCLRGPASVARDNDIMLIGQWKMEYDLTELDFFSDVIGTAKAYPNLPLSRLYCWSGRITLKGNSESGFLLCVPLRSKDGTVFGLWGIEVSDRLFKSLYTPEGGDFENIFTVMAPSLENVLCSSKGLIAGNSYLTGNRWDFDLKKDEVHEDFVHYSGNNDRYAGQTTSVRLYPNGSPYETQSWSVAILMPYETLHTAVEGNISTFMWIVMILLVTSLISSIILSRRFLIPVNEAFSSIKNSSHDEVQNTPYTEINDLFEFLSAKDREHEEALKRLDGEKSHVKSQYEQAQTYITHLTDERMPEVSEDDFKMFLMHLHTLTPKEREIFDYYLDGKKAKEIMEISCINQNTLKYHNRNIYSKLGVSSRKQLLEFATLMKYNNK